MRSERSCSWNMQPTSRARSTTPWVCNHLSPSGDKNSSACFAAQSMMLVCVPIIWHLFDISLQVLPKTDKDTRFDACELRYFVLTIHATDLHVHLIETDA